MHRNILKSIQEEIVSITGRKKSVVRKGHQKLHDSCGVKNYADHDKLRHLMKTFAILHFTYNLGF